MFLQCTHHCRQQPAPLFIQDFKALRSLYSIAFQLIGVYDDPRTRRKKSIIHSFIQFTKHDLHWQIWSHPCLPPSRMFTGSYAPWTRAAGGRACAWQMRPDDQWADTYWTTDDGRLDGESTGTGLHACWQLSATAHSVHPRLQGRSGVFFLAEAMN